MSELNPLGKEHRSVTMGVEGQGLVVNLVNGMEGGRFAYQPLEERFPFAETLRMPLYTYDRFEFSTLYRLDDSVGCCCDNTESFAGILDSLMMERVNIEGRLPLIDL